MVAVMAGAAPAAGAPGRPAPLHLALGLCAALLAGYVIGHKNGRALDDGAERATGTQLW
jgi:hypothetical protein